jgi:hypothetical protein
MATIYKSIEYKYRIISKLYKDESMKYEVQIKLRGLSSNWRYCDYSSMLEGAIEIVNKMIKDGNDKYWRNHPIKVKIL